MGVSLAQRFLSFAEASEASGSPLYAEWARGVASDPELLAVVERAPAAKRQPALVFAATRYLGGPVDAFPVVRAWMLRNAVAIVAELEIRFTQTNDVRRTGPVAAALALAGVDGPVALLEVGASAGLGLYPDRYDIRVGAARLGDPESRVHVAVDVLPGAQEPALPALPPIAARFGLDLAPVDPRRPGELHWLEMLLPPERTDRVELLRDAVDVLLDDPAPVIAGDAVQELPDLVALAPPGTTPVVVTSGTLVYLPGARRQAFVDLIAGLGVRWVSYERSGLLTGVASTVPVPAPSASDPDAFATLALDGTALAVGDAHGTRLRWLPSASPDACRHGGGARPT